MDKSDFYNCTTVYMGKYLENNTQEEYDEEIDIAKHFVNAFALWFGEDYFDRDKGYYSIKISYSNTHFFKEEILQTIKFFMQFYHYETFEKWGGQ